MVQKEAPETTEAYLKSSKIFTLFPCSKKACSEKSSGPHMISAAEILTMLKGKNLPKRYKNAPAVMKTDKERS